MENSQVDQLLVEANRAVERAEWQAAIDSLEQAAGIEPQRADILTSLGKCLLQLGQTGEAVKCFEQATSLRPQSAEACNNLGVAFSLNGQFEAAARAFEAAVALDGQHLPAWKNLAVAYLQQGNMGAGVQTLAALVRAHPEDVEALFLLGRLYEEGEEVDSARLLYERVLKLRPSHAEARASLERLPRPAIAVPAGRRAPLKPAIAFLGPASAEVEARLGPVALGLDAQGYRVSIAAQASQEEIESNDVLVVARPHSAPALQEAVSQARQAGKLVWIDLDQDFFNLPPEHPQYAQLGPGNQGALAALGQMLGLASGVVVSSPALAERCRKFNPNVRVAPNGWSRANSLWDKAAPNRRAVQVGIAGTHVLPKDAQALKAALARVMNANPQILLAVSADMSLYEYFSNIPEDRRLFLPAGRYEDYPFTLSHFDILLVPCQPNPFNQARSDLPLLEAGIRRIPWVATRLPSFQAWEEGGLFANSGKEWERAIERLIEDLSLRRRLGEAGRRKAERRELTAGAAELLSAYLPDEPLAAGQAG